MTIDSFDKIWAETGDTGTTPTDEKIEVGNVRYDKPTWQQENWLQNRVEQKLNNVVTNGSMSLYDGSTDKKKMVVSGLFDESWASSGDVQNIIEGGSTKAYGGMVAHIDADDKSFVIVGDNTNSKFEKWNTKTLALDSTSAAWSADLPASTTDWALYDLCTDNEYIYGLLVGTINNNSAFYIQSWTVNDLTVNPSWPSTGLEIPDNTVLGIESDIDERPRIIIASATKLATLNTWNFQSDEKVSIINKADGVLGLEGRGDVPVGTEWTANAFASDGTNLFFRSRDSSDDSERLCSATIADPTTGVGGSFPLALSAEQDLRTICSMGNLMFAGLSQNASVTTPVIGFAFDSSNPQIHSIIRETGDDQNIMANCYESAFDGVNLWLCAKRETSTSPDNIVSVKIDAGKLFPSGGAYDTQLDNITNGSLVMNQLSATTDASYRLNFVFDGRDIWLTPDFSAGQTHSGKIVRIPLALSRG